MRTGMKTAQNHNLKHNRITILEIKNETRAEVKNKNKVSITRNKNQRQQTKPNINQNQKLNAE